MCDLQQMFLEKPKQMELEQDVMQKIMRKMFKEERRLKNE